MKHFQSESITEHCEGQATSRYSHAGGGCFAVGADGQGTCPVVSTRVSLTHVHTTVVRAAKAKATGSLRVTE